MKNMNVMRGRRSMEGAVRQIVDYHHNLAMPLKDATFLSKGASKIVYPLIIILEAPPCKE
jgi:hypothetical protein